jgi:hypothetical protein
MYTTHKAATPGSLFPRSETHLRWLGAVPSLVCVPHTVRACPFGLATKGMHVEALDRIGQIGANRRDTKGSYFVYRLYAEVEG